MDGRGRAIDNVFVERLWRTVKYEDIYLNDYASAVDLHRGLTRYFQFHVNDRLHSALGYRTPEEVYHEKTNGSFIREIDNQSDGKAITSFCG